MEKIIKFLKENFVILVLILILFSGLRECRNTKEIKLIKKGIITLNDSLYQKKELDLKLEIINLTVELEGLKSEKRMIQATDRKIMDVNRQSEIDKEVALLEGKLKKYDE